MPSPALIFDDRDPLISYTGGVWVQSGIAVEYNGTTTYSYQKGATASLKFSGTGVSVWGTLSEAYGLPISSYSIDGGYPTIDIAKTVQTTQYQRLFFQSTELTASSHTLVIIMHSDNTTIFLDFIAVTPLVTASITTTSTVTTTTSTVTVTLSAKSISVPSSTPVLSPTPSPQVVSSTNNVPSIAGGVVGSLALLVFAFIAFMFLRRKKIQDGEQHTVDNGGR